MHFAQSETNWIQFWIWINFLNWCSVTKFFLVATPLNAHTLTSFNSEMDDILINITFDCFSWRTLSRLLHGMDDPPLSVKNPKKGEINSGFGSTSKIGAQCHVEIHWHVLILRGWYFIKHDIWLFQLIDPKLASHLHGMDEPRSDHNSRDYKRLPLKKFRIWINCCGDFWCSHRELFCVATQV